VRPGLRPGRGSLVEGIRGCDGSARQRCASVATTAS
jgi:hypothetical protein